MKLTVLVDNNTLIDRYFSGEPGVSYMIEESGKKILFDVGYSDLFAKNAHKMDIGLSDMDYVVISHGHMDHTWGLLPYVQILAEKKIEKIEYKKPILVGHQDVFHSKYVGEEIIGSLLDETALNRFFTMKLQKNPFWITEKLVFLGEIQRVNHFENMDPIGTSCYLGEEKADYVLDDSAVVFKSSEGLVIITGCSHSGICNIIEQAKKICQDDRVIDVIGGLHLLNPSTEQLEGTKAYLSGLDLKALHACHCTDLHSKIELSKVSNLLEVGVGTILTYE